MIFFNPFPPRSLSALLYARQMWTKHGAIVVHEKTDDEIAAYTPMPVDPPVLPPSPPYDYRAVLAAYAGFILGACAFVGWLVWR